MHQQKKCIWLLFITVLLIISFQAAADVKLPKIFADNMVLQRDRVVKVWGWAQKGESITLYFNGQVVKGKAGKDGAWLLSLQPMKHGGPYEMKINGEKQSITLKNILIGDVWLGSGQSNMEWVLKDTKDAAVATKEANYPQIRLFTVEKDMGYKVKADLKGGQWMECNPTTIGDFSAVAYYFGRNLHQELDVPIGLINSSWGGTNIETWISWESMSQDQTYKNSKPEDLDKLLQQSEANKQKYLNAMQHDIGLEEKWFEPTTVSEGWKNVEIPKEWSETSIGNVDGIVWFKKVFNVPATANGVEAQVSLGPIDDIDATYLNGVFLGSENVYNKDRVYPVKAGIIKPGVNTLVVKVTDNQGGGGLVGRPDQMHLTWADQKIQLDGPWTYKPSVISSDFGVMNTGPNSYPSLLYNAMIAPIVQYPIRGVIWYQGEANTTEAYRYRALFPNLINNWRNKWGYDFPFLWAQLANFMKPSDQPAQSQWAELREAQSMTLSVPKTGQAVIIDIGEEFDIHPRNKLDVGLRLARVALKGEYGKDIVYSGPVYRTMTVNNDKIELTFSHVGQGLKAKDDKYGYLRGFAIAGSDQKFVWAKAFINGDKVIVYSDAVKSPVAVRYAWGDNPDDANLYNIDGLPASPFRTDSWRGLTEP